MQLRYIPSSAVAVCALISLQGAYSYYIGSGREGGRLGCLYIRSGREGGREARVPIHWEWEGGREAGVHIYYIILHIIYSGSELN